MLKDIISRITKDINKLTRTKSEVMEDCIRKKLDISLENYMTQLSISSDYALSRDPIVISKDIDKVIN